MTFGAPKVGAALLPGAEFAGAIEVVDIGFDDDAMQATASSSPNPPTWRRVLPRDRSTDTRGPAGAWSCSRGRVR